MQLWDFTLREHEAQALSSIFEIDASVSGLDFFNCDILLGSKRGGSNSSLFNTPSKVRGANTNVMVNDGFNQNLWNLANVNSWNGGVMTCNGRTAKTANVGNYKIIDVDGIRNIGTP